MAKYWTADPESMMPYFARTNNIGVVVVGGGKQQFWNIASSSPAPRRASTPGDNCFLKSVSEQGAFPPLLTGIDAK